MTEEERQKIIAKIDFEEKWLFSLYAEHRLSTGDIDIAMSGIRSVVSKLKGEKDG